MKQLLIILLFIVSSCATPGFIPKCPTYSYEYKHSDGTIGYNTSIVQYDVGDKIELFPSGNIIVITKISLK